MERFEGRDEEQDKNQLKPPNLQHELHTSDSASSIIIDEKDTVEVYFKTDDTSEDDLDAAELSISSVVTIQPISAVSIKGENDIEGHETVDCNRIIVENQNEPIDKVEENNANYIVNDTDLDFYPLSSDVHQGCCYRCWYSERCNACIIGLIDRIPDKCLCPCLLSCYRCLQVVLCCDWSAGLS